MLYYNSYVRAQSLEEAYELAQKRGNIVLGGMLWQKMANKTVQTAIDLCDLGLNQIEETKETFSIGAYVSLRALEQNEALNQYTHGAIREALSPIVGVQFRNVATVGGSIWGRYGFSDVMTILMALGAKVELFHAGELSMEEFIGMSRQTKDILVRVIVPKKDMHVVYKSQRNSATDFPVLTCAVTCEHRADGTNHYAATIGARPKIAKTIFASEEDLAESVSEQLSFGDNIRAGAEYRRKICQVLIRRGLEELMDLSEYKEA